MEEAVRTGCLYLVATPIGNLEDITERAKRVLGSVDLVAAEDTRHTMRLLSSLGIRARLISYREQNHRAASRQVLQILGEGKAVALVSDAGTPALNDPGRQLVEEALEKGFCVSPLPGPSAITAALAASGLFRHSFLFAGFPPRQPEALRRWAEECSAQTAALVFFESPSRLGRTLAALTEVIGERRAVVAREISKLHEEFQRGTIRQLAARYHEGALGEITVVIEGAEKKERAGEPPPEWAALALALARGEKLPAARIAELLAVAGGFERRQTYRWLVKLLGGGGR